MKRRVLAWVMLIGFVLLIVNLLTIRYQPVLSFAIYFMVLVSFLFANRKPVLEEKEPGSEDDK
jgi:hypothetical protein